jgi:hypothetical protein
MRTGEVIANLLVLNEHFRLGQLDELVVRKRAGAEKMLLDDAELGAHGALLDGLETMLQEAHDRSSLPEEPTTAAALDDFVVRIRLDAARRG